MKTFSFILILYWSYREKIVFLLTDLPYFMKMILFCRTCANAKLHAFLIIGYTNAKIKFHIFFANVSVMIYLYRRNIFVMIHYVIMIVKLFDEDRGHSRVVHEML